MRPSRLAISPPVPAKTKNPATIARSRKLMIQFNIVGVGMRLVCAGYPLRRTVAKVIPIFEGYEKYALLLDVDERESCDCMPLPLRRSCHTVFSLPICLPVNSLADYLPSQAARGFARELATCTLPTWSTSALCKKLVAQLRMHFSRHFSVKANARAWTSPKRPPCRT